jgi:hypothetical protein
LPPVLFILTQVVLLLITSTFTQVQIQRNLGTTAKHVPRRPPVYKIANYDGEELEGTSYQQELQKVNKSDS